MSNIQIKLPSDVTRIWDLEVPIVHDKDTDHIKAYLTDGIQEPGEYNELCYLLDTASKTTTIDLHINCPGGIVDSAFMIANSIQSSKATVTAILSGTVASAATLITMVCDKVLAQPHLSFMIHNYSGGMSGKGHEMKARQKFVDDHLNRAFKTFYSGFLTEEEMDKVIEGTDIWMPAEEVTERWNNRIEYVKGVY